MLRKTLYLLIVVVLVASTLNAGFGESAQQREKGEKAGIVTVTRPGQGAILSATVQQNIEWWVGDWPPSVFYISIINYSLDSGSTWNNIASNVSTFLGPNTYPWTPPLVDISGTCQIKVTCWNDTNMDGYPDGYIGEGTSGFFSLDATPPYIVSTSPANNEKNVEVDTAITITFSEPMNTAKSEAAFSLRNASGGIIDGTFAWSGGDTVLTFYPNGSLEENMTYTCYVLSTATDKSDPGNPMQSDYMFQFKTIEPLQNVTFYQPTSTTIWSGNCNQTIRYEIVGGKRLFNLTYYYSIDDGSTWVEIGNKTNSSMYVDTFTWSVPYLNSTEVRLKINVTDAKGNTTENISEKFTVDSAKPLVVEITPMNGTYTVPLNTTIRVVFSEPMNTQSVESAFSLETGYQQLNGVFTWENNNTTMIFTPSANLSYQTTYYVNITPMAKDISTPGNSLDLFQAEFTTVPNILLTLTEPSGGEIWTGGSTKVIAWNIQNGYPPYNITVYSSTNSGATYPTIVGSKMQNQAGNENLTVTVPLLNITTYRYQIKATDAKGFVAYANMSSDITIDSGAPVITSCNIQNNTQVSISTWINLTFSEKMDELSVQNAFSLETGGIKVPGTFTWTNNSLTFKPTAKLQYGKTYYLNISGTAKDLSNPGNYLAPFYRVFYTAKPHNLSLLEPNQTMVFSGHYMMNISWNFTGGEGPWTLEIAMSKDNGTTFPETVTVQTITEGRGSYLWELPPIDAPNVKIRVRVTDAQGISSQVISQRFGIDSTKPSVQEIKPENGSESIEVTTSEITILFSEPVVNSTAEGAITLAGVSKVTGESYTPSYTLAWSENYTKLTLKLSGLLYLSHIYYINLSGTVKDTSVPGNYMDFYSAFFSTPLTDNDTAPEVTTHYPKKNAYGIPVKMPVIINFSKPMSIQDTNMAISITPSATGRIEWRENDTQFYFTPDLLKPSTTYTVKVSRDACDKARIWLRYEYTFSFTTASSVDHGAVFGYVMEENETGYVKPLLNATVKVYRGEMLVMSNILTDADGYFYINLQGSTEGITYIIEVTKEGYNVSRKNVTVFAGYITDAGTIGISVVNKTPIAGFVYTPSTPTTSDTIQFTDTSTDSDGTIVAWSWDFGDGTQSTLQNPTHKYSRKGSYTVSLTVRDNDGGTNTITKTINVENTNPLANFTWAPSSPTTSDTIQFTDTSTDSDGTIVAWSWDFGDGTQSTLQNPTHKYSRKGIYSVTLTVIDDDGGTHTVTKTIEVAETPGSPGVSGVSSMWWLLGIVLALVILVAVFLVYLLKKKKKWRRTETTK